MTPIKHLNKEKTVKPSIDQTKYCHSANEYGNVICGARNHCPDHWVDDPCPANLPSCLVCGVLQ